MAAVEYDLDTSGGLMEEIIKLTAPPVSEDLVRKQRRQDRERRRHGRAINHDCCDSCKEGGDLLCCDRCPAAFHLQCHDPPLDEDELPPGEWICHRCRISPPEPEEDESTSGSIKTGTKSRVKRQHSKDEEKEHPLQMLAKAAKLINPVQFELTKDIACTTPLPGSSKRRPGMRASNKKLPHEHDNGIVPLPAKVCFICSKSCRVSPLIQCDYCPLLFHQDCLNPPLTTLPTGRWMCPNHVEHAVDEKLLHSVGLHERVQLWDRFSGHIDQHAVKIQFLRQGHRLHPPFRLKRKLPCRKTISIPAAIKQHYQNPPSLLPQAVSGLNISSSQSPTPKEHVEITLEEQEEWLTAVVSLQTSIAKFLAQKQLHKATEGAKTADTSKSDHGKPTASVAPVVHKDCDMHDQEDSVEENVSKAETFDCDRTSLNGSAVCSPVQESFSNGPFEVSKGSTVSLLHGTTSATVNGDIDFVNLQRTKPDAVVIRTRSNSGDSPTPNIVKVNWPLGDKPSATSNSTSSVPHTQGKNIVISAINKSNNTVVTKVLSHSNQGNKTVSANSSTKTVVVSNPTSILSPRITVQPSIKVATTGSQNKCSVSHTIGTITSPKVITVSASPSGGKLNSGSITTAVSKGANLSNSNSLINNLNNTLQQFIEGNTESELSKIDEKLIQILAWQRLQQLMSDKSDVLPTKKGVLNGLLQQSSEDGSCEIRARAVLCPLTGKGQAIPMPYRTMGIGTGADMDVCLNQFGYCNFVSPKHACIFYDEMTKHYELLNYSEHGTTVDNVLYSCDFSDKSATTPQPSPVVAAVREVISKAKQKLEDEEQKRITMTAKANDHSRHCNCRVSSSSLIGGSGAGWEGTALLHHGSYIKVGCLQFVFSIVDQAASEPIVERRSESMSLLKTHLKAAQ